MRSEGCTGQTAQGLHDRDDPGCSDVRKLRWRGVSADTRAEGDAMFVHVGRGGVPGHGRRMLGRGLAVTALMVGLVGTATGDSVDAVAPVTVTFSTVGAQTWTVPQRR